MRWLVLGGALLQPVMAYWSATGMQSVFMDPTRNPTIAPAAYAFSIWGIITGLCVAYALYQLLYNRNRELYARIAPYTIGLFIGFALWLVAAGANSLVGTVAVFMVMGFCLYRIFSSVVTWRLDGRLSRVEWLVTYATFGLYSGWASMAIFANVAASLYLAGWPNGVAGQWWQGGILMAAVGTALAITYHTKGSGPYVAAVLWALVAIMINTLAESVLLLTVLSGVGIAAIASVTVWFAVRNSARTLRA